MTMFILLLLNAFICFVNGQSETLINYYEHLINASLEEYKKFKPPTDNFEYMPDSWILNELEEADFIIIGSGTAGSIIANRLSEVEKWKILVIEAGSFENNFTEIPIMSTFNTRSKFDWSFESEPDINGEKMKIPKGKGVGGSTLINGMRYVRGSKSDFDYWAKEGNRGWSYEEVLPYFKKLENVSIPNGDFGYHGTSGPMHVEYYKPLSPHIKMALDANIEFGNQLVDYNGQSQLGVSPSQQWSQNGRRISTGTGYVKPLTLKRNVKILTDSYVFKILIDFNTKEANGVWFSKHKKLYKVKARKEIILSAGVVNSPHILMLSGIGPKDDLENLGIKVIQDLDVGKHLVDHPSFESMWFSTNFSQNSRNLREYIREYLNGYGFLTNSVGVEGLGFHKITHDQESNDADVIMAYLTPNPALDLLKQMCSYTYDDNDALQSSNEPSSSILISIIATHPKSRGFIKLKSKNPFERPMIYLNLLSDEGSEDLNTLYKAVDLALKISSTSAFKKFGALLKHFNVPACKSLREGSQEYWKCTITHLTGGGYHMMGTCKMGSTPSLGAVVDESLTVHGIKKLRVADASVIIKTSGYPAGVAMMIGEKVSDIIKVEHGVLI